MHPFGYFLLGTIGIIVYLLLRSMYGGSVTNHESKSASSRRIRRQRVTCPTCEGSKYWKGEKCIACDGKGWQMDTY